MPLDFSEFHPLDHWAGDSRCRSLPGGTMRHIELWLDYQAPDPLGALFCRLGRHEWVEGWKGMSLNDTLTEEPNWIVCARCHADHPTQPGDGVTG